MTTLNANPLEVSFRVVLVTDQASTQAFLERCLPSDTIVLQSIGGLAAALESVTLAPPDLVILDADSEQLLALEICGPLKTHGATALVPVVAVARSGRHRLAAYVAGADEFLSLRNAREDITACILNMLQSADRRRKLANQQLDAEIRRSEQIREAFRRYVSPKLVDRILANAELRDTLFTQQSVRTRAVVMFADMRGFTSMSERLSADLIVVLLNQYFTLLTEVAFHHDGTVFNMSGDCLMVGFGVPMEQNDGLERAIKTASEMLSRFRELAIRWQEDYQIETGLGIGINEGEVIAGNVGSAAYMNYTIIGDTVNVAARLTQRARAGEILFSQAVKHTLDLRGYEVEALALPPLTLRGRSAPIDIFCVPTSDRVELHADRVTH